MALCLFLPVCLRLPLSTSLLLPLYSLKVTTSLRRRQCSYRRKTMRALALCLGEPKVSLFCKIHLIFFCLYRFFQSQMLFLLSLSLISLSLPSFSNPCSRYLCPLMLILLDLSSAAQTPIEEFTPTPAFPALQYLESVDEGGVAWRAGLRMGDFLIEVRTRCVLD